MNMPDFVISTLEIRLEQISEKYAEPIFNALDEQIIRYLLMEKLPASISDTFDFIHESKEKIKKGTDLIYVIIDKENNFCGCAGMHAIHTRTPQLGIWLKNVVQRKGYGLQIIKTFVNWIQQNLDYDYIKYPVDRNNMPSIKIVQQLGGEICDEYILGENKKLDVLEFRIYNPLFKIM